MLRLIALPVCLALIALLILQDYKRRPKVSWAMWIPTALLLILGSRPVSLWLHGGQAMTVEMGNEQETSLLDAGFFFVEIAFSFFIATSRGVKWAKLFAGNFAIIVFYVYFMVSISWSGDPSGSFKRIVKDFGLLFVIGLIFSEKEPLQAMRAVYIRCAMVLLPLSVLTIKYFPSIARTFGLNGDILVTGVTTQKNGLGEIVLIFTLFLLWDYLETYGPGKRLRWNKGAWDQMLLIAMGVWLLEQSKSKTALLCIAVGMFVMLRPKFLVTKLFNRLLFIMALTTPLLLFFSQQFNSVIEPMVKALGRDMTFTGRGNIWAHITLKTVNPIVGYGYWNFWGGPDGYEIARDMKTVIPNAHNGYLDIYLDGGFIGLALLFMVLIVCGSRIMRKVKATPDGGLFAKVRFSILIVVIIYNLSESTFARMEMIWFTTLMMMVEFPTNALSKKKRPATFESKAAGDRRRPVLQNI